MVRVALGTPRDRQQLIELADPELAPAALGEPESPIGRFRIEAIADGR